MAKTSFQLDDEVDEAIEDRLSYGDSKSEWLRQAVELRLACDEMLDEVFEQGEHEERIEFVEEAVENAVKDKD